MKKLLLPLLFFSSTVFAQVKWEKQFKISGNAFTVIESASQVIETSDKGFLVAGSGRTGTERPFGFLLKLSASGDSLWCRIYDTIYIPRISGLFYNSNNELMGVFERLITGQKTDIIFSKVNETNGDTSGSFIVPKSPGSGGHQYRKHVELADGSYVVAGQDNSSTSMGAATLVRFMPGSNTPVWTAENLAKQVSVFYDMLLDGDKLVLAGTNGSVLLKSNFYVAKYNLDGTAQWQRTLIYPGEWAPTTAAYAIRKNNAGNYLVSGHWAVKPEMIMYAAPATAVIGPDGDSLSMSVEPLQQYGMIRKMISTPNGLYGVGLSNAVVKAPDNMDYPVGYMGVFGINQQGNTALMNKFNSTGIVNDPFGTYTGTNADANGVLATSDGDLLISGKTEYVDAQKKIHQCTYLVKYKPEPVSSGLREQMLNKLTVYPNPASDFIAIGEAGKSISQLEITDITGRVVYLQEHCYETQHISVKELSGGHYFIRCMQGAEVFTGRFIKTDQ